MEEELSIRLEIHTQLKPIRIYMPSGSQTGIHVILEGIFEDRREK